MERSKKRAVLFVVFVIIYICFHVLFAKGLGKALGIPKLGRAYVQLASYACLGIWGICLFFEDLKKGFSQWGKGFLKSILWLIGGFAADYVLMILFSIPLYLLRPEYEMINENNVSGLIGVVPGLLILVICGALGPITEETVFRFVPMLGLKDKLPAALGIALSGLLFGMVHMHAFTIWEFLAVLPHVATGLVYAFVLRGSRNATIPILLHLLNNVPAILGMLLAN